jgi:hypothetical protein
MTTPEYGSRFDLLQWVVGRQPRLNQALRGASRTLREFSRGIEWLAPDPITGGELRDGAWARVGLLPPSPQAAGWWPVGGPTWDGVARVRGPQGAIGALFVEANGHPGELRPGGAGAKNDASHAKITNALADVQNELGVRPGTDWTGPVYQPANRLGWLWFARHHQSHREAPLPVWLVSIYFSGAHYPWSGGQTGPADEAAWRPHIEAVHQEMALPDPPEPLSHHWIELFLPSTLTDRPA